MWKKLTGIARSMNWTRLIAFAIVASMFFGQDSLFIVREGEAVVVTRFGGPVRTYVTPGLRLKLLSPIEQIHRLDRRRQILSTPETAGFTLDKRNIILTTYVVWRIEDPLRFLQNIGDVEAARSNLAGMTLAARNELVGRRPLTAFVSLDKRDIQVAEVETLLTERVDSAARSRFGIAVDQVGIERISFPEENLNAVLNRMRVERMAEASRLRAEGTRAAQAIRDDAHVQSQEIVRKGREKAAEILANAELEASVLASRAHQADPEFYRFWSELQASARVLREKSTLVLSSKQLFFRALQEPSVNEGEGATVGFRRRNDATSGGGRP